MTMEEKVRRRVREWTNMARAFQGAREECEARAATASEEGDGKREREEQQEAALNQAWQEALERCAENLADDLTSTGSALATSRPASVA